MKVEVDDVVILAVGCVYLILAAVITPDFFRVAGALGPAYAMHTARTRSRILLHSPEVYWWLAAALAWWVRRRRPGDAAGTVLMAACAGSLLAVVVQGKGWLYHFLPLTVFSALLGAYACALRAPHATRSQRVARALAVAILLATFAPLLERTVRINWVRASGQVERRVEIHDLLEALARQPRARSLQVLSSDISPTFPLVELAGLTEHHTLPHLWVPEAVYRSHLGPDRPVTLNPPGRMAAAERTAFEAVIRDLERQPDLLLVESRRRNESNSGYPGGFDHLAYYAQDTVTRNTLRRYRLVDRVQGFDLYARGRPTE